MTNHHSLHLFPASAAPHLPHQETSAPLKVDYTFSPTTSGTVRVKLLLSTFLRFTLLCPFIQPTSHQTSFSQRGIHWALLPFFTTHHFLQVTSPLHTVKSRNKLSPPRLPPQVKTLHLSPLLIILVCLRIWCVNKGVFLLHALEKSLCDSHTQPKSFSPRVVFSLQCCRYTHWVMINTITTMCHVWLVSVVSGGDKYKRFQDFGYR